MFALFAPVPDQGLPSDSMGCGPVLREVSAEALFWCPYVEQALVRFPPQSPYVDVTKALRIIDCESRGLPWAWNRGGRTAGLLQHKLVYWGERAAAAGVPSANPWCAPWRTGSSC